MAKFEIDATKAYLNDLSVFYNFGQDITYYNETQETVDIINAFLDILAKFLNNYGKYECCDAKQELETKLSKIFKEYGYKQLCVDNIDGEIGLFLMNISEQKRVLDYYWFFSFDCLESYFEDQISEDQMDEANKIANELNEYIGTLAIAALKKEAIATATYTMNLDD